MNISYLKEKGVFAFKSESVTELPINTVLIWIIEEYIDSKRIVGGPTERVIARWSNSIWLEESIHERIPDDVATRLLEVYAEALDSATAVHIHSGVRKEVEYKTFEKAIKAILNPFFSSLIAEERKQYKSGERKRERELKKAAEDCSARLKELGYAVVSDGSNLKIKLTGLAG